MADAKKKHPLFQSGGQLKRHLRECHIQVIFPVTRGSYTYEDTFKEGAETTYLFELGRNEEGEQVPVPREEAKQLMYSFEYYDRDVTILHR